MHVHVHTNTHVHVSSSNVCFVVRDLKKHCCLLNINEKKECLNACMVTSMGVGMPVK